jgi:HAD superfamily hydrolase (TIGR01509 family)
MFRKQIKLIPGTGEVLEALVTEGLILGLVTSTPMEYMAVKLVPLQKAGLDSLLKIIITSDDVENKKPHAEPLVKCSQKLGVAADKCVYIGDTRVDIKAGNAAGMKTIGVLSGFDDHDALSKENPDVIIGSIAELFKAVTITLGGNDERHAARSAEKFN